jgi:3-oxoacyl-[acyl-carrier protein] reductase
MSSGIPRPVRALVTGAATGIGRATARRLARDGFEVALHYHTHASEAESLLEEIRKGGGSGFSVGADLAAPDQVAHLAHAVTERWDSLDVLVHNAGAYPRASVGELDPAAFEAPFRVHVFGAAELTRRLRPALHRADPARIVFVSSILAFTGSRHGAHYAAAKAAVLGLARSLALELAPRIRVNVVAPGSIDTAILRGDTPEERARREKTIPLGRVGTAEEVAEAIAFLVSDRSSYLTGTTIHVNGGLRMD